MTKIHTALVHRAFIRGNVHVQKAKVYLIINSFNKVCQTPIIDLFIAYFSAPLFQLSF